MNSLHINHNFSAENKKNLLNTICYFLLNTFISMVKRDSWDLAKKTDQLKKKYLSCFIFPAGY